MRERTSALDRGSQRHSLRGEPPETGATAHQYSTLATGTLVKPGCPFMRLMK
jgi:hypothetical protein